jgi:hypothetical protein
LTQSGVVWAGLAGLTFGTLGFLTALVLLTNLFLGAFAIPATPSLAAVAAFVVGGPCWWLLVERPRNLTRMRGAFAGLLTGLLTQPVLWFLVVVYQEPELLTNPAQLTELAVFSGFVYLSVLATGTVTMTVGVFVGLALMVLRERTVPGGIGERRNLAMVAFTFVSLAVVIVVALPFVWVVLIVLPIAFYGAVLFVILLTLLVLRRLDVVRTFLVRSYRLAGNNSVSTLFRPSFVLRHSIATLGSVIAYLFAFVGYIALMRYVDSLVFSGPSPLVSETLSYQIAFPILFAVVSLATALTVNYVVNRWEPSRSRRRAAIEWTLYLLPVVVVYAGISAFWIRSV